VVNTLSLLKKDKQPEPLEDRDRHYDISKHYLLLSPFVWFNLYERMMYNAMYGGHLGFGTPVHRHLLLSKITTHLMCFIPHL
jgi:hypothetical protein